MSTEESVGGRRFRNVGAAPWPAETRRLGVGMVGYAFMGAAHSQAWRSVNRFFDLPLEVDRAVIAGRTASTVAAAATKLGWSSYTTSWRELVEREDVDLIDICTPSDSHAEIAIAALEAGKHVLCEKPLARTLEEGEQMVVAAERARSRGVRSMVGFNYRRVPALALARSLVQAGRLGTVRHVRTQYLQEWLVDPQFPLTWRLQRERAGSGALGDIGAHIVDAAQFVLDDHLTGVSALTETFVRERPRPGPSDRGDAPDRGEVTVDDCALFLGRFAGGAVATFEATRYATGRRNALRLEINGSQGSVAFDLESLNELWFHDGADPGAMAGFRRVLATHPDHPYMAAWWPQGHIIGYEHTFTHQARDLLAAIAADEDPVPSFADGLRVQRVLHGVEASAADGRWFSLDSF
jgi:predicted dehydrogenase